MKFGMWTKFAVPHTNLPLYKITKSHVVEAVVVGVVVVYKVTV